MHMDATHGAAHTREAGMATTKTTVKAAVKAAGIPVEYVVRRRDVVWVEITHANPWELVGRSAVLIAALAAQGLSVVGSSYDRLVIA